MNTYKIINIGEFLNNLFEELNDTGKPYAPYISIKQETTVNDEE